MAKARLCSRQTCTREAIYTLTYAYATSTAVIGALSQFREPHAYDLCEFHAARLTAPQGWEVVRMGDAQAAAEAAVVEDAQTEAQISAPEYPKLRGI